MILGATAARFVATFKDFSDIFQINKCTFHFIENAGFLSSLLNTAACVMCVILWVGFFLMGSKRKCHKCKLLNIMVKTSASRKLT